MFGPRHTHDDHNYREERERECEAESLDHLRDLDEEVGAFDLLLRRAPLNIVRDQVGDEGLGQVDRQTAEEEEAAGGFEQEPRNVGWAKLTRTEAT
jgi:hypothetical protein